MRSIFITEKNKTKDDYIRNSRILLPMEKCLCEKYYDWLTFKIVNNCLHGEGTLCFGIKKFSIELYYSYLFDTRFDRIFIRDKKLSYNKDIHLYKDLSLCLYHPIIDKPKFNYIPLFKIISWISEWCIHYEEYKKYGVWFGKEIKH